MKRTGIVRRVDSLGRFVVPKEMRKNLRINEDDPLEIYIQGDDEIVFKKYSSLANIGQAAYQFSESIYEVIDRPVIISDRDKIISVVGFPVEEYIGRRVSASLDNLLEEKWHYYHTPGTTFFPVEGMKTAAYISLPIVGNIEVFGSLSFLFRPDKEDDLKEAAHLDIDIAKTFASFLAKQCVEI